MARTGAVRGTKRRDKYRSKDWDSSSTR